MIVIERGKIQKGQVVLPSPIALPEGTEVQVRIETALPIGEEKSEATFFQLPFFGMWADCEDMEDSAAWVRKERESWGQRSTPSA